MEEWRPIPGWPGYSVSNLGRVRSEARVIVRRNRGGERPARIRERILAPRPSHQRLSVHLSAGGRKQSRFIHHLVLEAFVGPCPEGMETCHNNGDPSDNRLENLRWDTHRSNIHDRALHGTDNRGDRHPMRKLCEADIPEIREMLADGVSQSRVAREFGVARTTIMMIATGRNWSHISAGKAA